MNATNIQVGSMLVHGHTGETWRVVEVMPNGNVVVTDGALTDTIPAGDLWLWSNNRQRTRRSAGRDEQRGRYIDCGPGAWDDR